MDFENRSELIIQSIQMISNDIKNPILKENLKDRNIEIAIKIELLEDKEIYFKTEIEILELFNELLKYDISLQLIEEYIKSAKKLAILEKELSSKVIEKVGFIPEILVLNTLNLLKPFIFNQETIKEFKKDN